MTQTAQEPKAKAQQSEKNQEPAAEQTAQEPKAKAQQSEKNQEPAAEQTAQEPKAKEAKPEAKPEKKKRVDPTLYQKFTDLKFLHLSGAKLTAEKSKELSDLTKEVLSASGPVATKTVRAAINNEICLMVEGMPVTEEIEAIIKSAEKTDYYLIKK